MILLLQGSTDLARVALAEKITKEHPQWRHLPVEGLLESEVFQEAIPIEPSEDLMMMLALHLAKEMHKKNTHILISYQDATAYLNDIRSELEMPFVSVFLHVKGPPPSGHDHILAAKEASVNDLYQQLKEIILNP